MASKKTAQSGLDIVLYEPKFPDRISPIQVDNFDKYRYKSITYVTALSSKVQAQNVVCRKGLSSIKRLIIAQMSEV